MLEVPLLIALIRQGKIKQNKLAKTGLISWNKTNEKWRQKPRDNQVY
jgi:hypothetical protein